MFLYIWHAYSWVHKIIYLCRGIEYTELPINPNRDDQRVGSPDGGNSRSKRRVPVSKDSGPFISTIFAAFIASPKVFFYLHFPFEFKRLLFYKRFGKTLTNEISEEGRVYSRII